MSIARSIDPAQPRSDSGAFLPILFELLSSGKHNLKSPAASPTARSFSIRRPTVNINSQLVLLAKQPPSPIGGDLAYA
ncbi:hypothetical protein FA95DRAFT_1610110 [Auriscalpium vulgare]|uniref:Uncharacterized protein n=1 Tax=Auriscalpium vulgare TaxID=40419 RepID=A0ACB8REP9_9AGAM|nr:hypothetical protein FA95DRAFT_1610110 [Auriscalpium vulgare]